MRGHWDRMGTGQAVGALGVLTSVLGHLQDAGSGQTSPALLSHGAVEKLMALCPTESPDCSLGALCVHPGEEPERRAAHPGQSPVQAGNGIRGISVATVVPGPLTGQTQVCLLVRFLAHPGAWMCCCEDTEAQGGVHRPKPCSKHSRSSSWTHVACLPRRGLFLPHWRWLALHRAASQSPSGLHRIPC